DRRRSLRWRPGPTRIPSGAAASPGIERRSPVPSRRTLPGDREMDSFDGESAANQAISAQLHPPRTTRWHRMYFFLAGFDVLVVVLSVLLNHLIVDTYHRSIKANQSWVQQLSSYSTLGSLASDVNAPGNNVFDTHDVESESRNMTAA